MPADARAHLGPDDGRSVERLLSGWGRTAPTRATVARPDRHEEVTSLLSGDLTRGVIARGLGRSYGDAAQCAGGLVVDVTGLDEVHGLDRVHGTVKVDAGVSLDALMRLLLPHGWFVPVTPGTRQVTVGGALAADIHGKNHHLDGSFCDHVERFTLVTPTGTVDVTPHTEPELFWATAGGMGLTGVVVDVTIRLRRVETALVRVDTERARDLDDVLARMDEGDQRYQYSVAWVDCLARGRSMGRSVLTRADHAGMEDLPARGRPEALRFEPRAATGTPPWLPSGLLNRASVRAFNALWFARATSEQGRLQSLDAFFHPLDRVEGWNRLYGRQGLIQYQFVLPMGQEKALALALSRLSAARCPSFLAVLKRFGPANAGPLSFPLPGWTLALDVPAGWTALAPVLDALDELVAEAGGRVYLAKDSRLRPDVLPVMYPRLDEWRRVQAKVDPTGLLRSDLSRRLRLVEDGIR